MERDEKNNSEKNTSVKKDKQPQKDITAYIGLQNQPLGGEPNISVSFRISLRLFCVAFAISRMEKDRDD